jgi:hypothetical protein
MTMPRDKVHNQAFNIGTTDENYRVRDLVDIILEANPQFRAVYTGEGSPDSRDYRVDFTKFARTFPDFEFAHTVRSEVPVLLECFARYGMTQRDVEGPKFIRLKTLQQDGAFAEHYLAALLD